MSYTYSEFSVCSCDFTVCVQLDWINYMCRADELHGTNAVDFLSYLLVGPCLKIVQFYVLKLCSS